MNPPNNVTLKICPPLKRKSVKPRSCMNFSILPTAPDERARLHRMMAPMRSTITIERKKKMETLRTLHGSMRRTTRLTRRPLGTNEPPREVRDEFTIGAGSL